jgi:hypothetical protein
MLFPNHTPGPNRRPRIVWSRRRRHAEAHLREGLAKLAERVGQPYVTSLRIQLVAQVCGPQSYVQWRQAIEVTWGRHGGDRYSASTWPAALGFDQCAAVLLPLPVGRVTTSFRHHPPLLASPYFTCGPGPPINRAGYRDVVLAVLASWVCNPSFAVTAQLAPPIVETIVQNRIGERRVESFGLEWPLPPIRGLS